MEGEDLNVDLPLLFIRICFFFEFVELLALAFLHELISEINPYDFIVLHVADQLPNDVGQRFNRIFFQLYSRILVFLMQPHILPSLDVKLKEDFIMLIDAIMPFPSLHYFLHVLAIAVHVDHSQPILDPNHHHIHILPQLDPALLAYLQVLHLENRSLSSLHAGHQSFDVQVLLP